MGIGLMALELNGLGRTVRGQKVLDDVSVSLPEGQVLVIAGINGAGKSSLIHSVVGLIKPSAGTIRIFGRRHDEAGARQSVAFLPERFIPPMHLSAHEVLVWLAGIRGRRWRTDQTRHALEGFGIEADAMHRALRHFSKGMTQKVGLLAVVFSEARLLILDEPMSGLDPLARRFVRTVLCEAKAQGRTMVLTSHTLSQIEDLCDMMMVLHQGRSRFRGSVAQLRQAHEGMPLEDAFLAAIETKDW